MKVQKLVSTEHPESTHLHAYYGYTLQLLSRRTQNKLHRSLKRVLCKKCSSPLQPGTNLVKVRYVHYAPFFVIILFSHRTTMYMRFEVVKMNQHNGYYAREFLSDPFDYMRNFRTRGKKRSKRLVMTCRICGTVKRFPIFDRKEGTSEDGTQQESVRKKEKKAHNSMKQKQ